MLRVNFLEPQRFQQQGIMQEGLFLECISIETIITYSGNFLLKCYASSNDSWRIHSKHIKSIELCK